MNIKGFDKDLCCRGFQFEIGREYKIDTDEPLSLCSNTVFHYCKSLRNVHKHYSCTDKTNRFCEIEVLGEEVTDGSKYGSNHIKIVREITGDELLQLKGLINGNTGLFNTGNYNTGNCNTGNRNTGYYNTGNFNTGNYNTGCRNTGDRNTGYYNTGNYNTGYYNTGDYNTGCRNTGDRNTGYYNTGYYNTGNFNTGNYNTGYYNTGDFNKCNNSSGIFCTEEENIRIFNMPSKMTLNEFRNSIYANALYSVPFILTEWVNYTDDEKAADKEKELIGGYLKSYTYKEACANWWAKMTEENKEIIKSMPNFNAEIFKEITGIEVEE